MNEYGTLPGGSLASIKPFELHIPEQQIIDFKQLLKLTPLASATYENQQEDRRYGVTRKWLGEAKEYWLNQFDWRNCEKHINSFPNFKAEIVDDNGDTFQIHFAALFSKKNDAVPIAFFHGWPGSFLEFLPMMDVIRKKYPASSLPYHIVVPSLVGYTLSSGPPLDKTFTSKDIARIMDKLMKMLGFGSGYVAQGGDIGSGVTRILATGYESCKAVHLNFCPADYQNMPFDKINNAEKEALQRRKEWSPYGTAYAMEHGTRPATIGFALAANPLSLLSWIGEKFLEWTDEDPSLDTILEAISLYWFTETFPRCIYPYRERWGRKEPEDHESGAKSRWGGYIDKPFGFSWFPYELIPTPKVLAAKTGNMVWHRQHTKGGHFAALERPVDFAQDMEDFVATVLPMITISK
ncbi:uncharacterized protein PV09_07743 [Verruconis gallopava]|uniref:Epoxide hydrolase N-terminal domain-containing protein n=1 Tax=Verruconis gallopava TaxID=253628 RepID=A0A0D1YIR3_9PEZI|nr:uncharacterized protein PV09_07743 [Verruconis gallopava]KIW00762.1 hypothetical protein PV09_07743 [Verruconis gallopava]